MACAKNNPATNNPYLLPRMPFVRGIFRAHRLPDPSPVSPHQALGFPPIAGQDPDILILGSLPGVVSLAQQQYYAHRQNVFWRILQALFLIDAHASYEARCAQVIKAKLAIWDVCHSAYREGSLDSAISASSVIANDINGLLTSAPTIRCIAFNGNAAAALFKKHVTLAHPVEQLILPSTSPANARLSFEQKLSAWRILQTRR